MYKNSSNIAEADSTVSVKVDVDTRGRDDCSVVEVPQDTVGYITGARRMALIAMEAEWGVFMSPFREGA